MRNPLLYGMYQGGKPLEQYLVKIKNAESSAEIERGTPVCLVFNGTDDGLAVVLPSTGAAAKATSLFYGIASSTIAAGKLGESVVAGFCTFVKMVRFTRAASTDAWATAPALAVGDILNVDTANNAMARVGSQAASAFAPFCVAAESLASQATQASTTFTTGDTRLAYTVGVKAFLRAM